MCTTPIRRLSGNTMYKLYIAHFKEGPTDRGILRTITTPYRGAPVKPALPLLTSSYYPISGFSRLEIVGIYNKCIRELCNTNFSLVPGFFLFVNKKSPLTSFEDISSVPFEYHTLFFAKVRVTGLKRAEFIHFSKADKILNAKQIGACANTATLNGPQDIVAWYRPSSLPINYETVKE